MVAAVMALGSCRVRYLGRPWGEARRRASGLSRKSRKRVHVHTGFRLLWGSQLHRMYLLSSPPPPMPSSFGKGSPTEQGMADAQVLAGWDLRKERIQVPRSQEG